MPTPSRRKSLSVIQQIIARPHDFCFFQAVRLLERAAVYSNREYPGGDGSSQRGSAPKSSPSKNSTPKNSLPKNRAGPGGLARRAQNPVARFIPPETEALRFHSHQALQFPSSEIRNITGKINRLGDEQWQMVIDFLGLTGAMGVMPYHYTELLLQRLKLKDQSMMAFFDLFNHRTTSLFYQAGTKYSLPTEYERNRLFSPATASVNKVAADGATRSLLSLIGLGTGKIAEAMHNPPESFLFYSGLLSQQIRSASGLQNILRHQFGIPVKIREFMGQWQELIDDVRSRLPCKNRPLGQNICLGRSAILGARGWFAQGKISILLGPLNKQQLKKFSPGTKALRSLNEWVRFYAAMETDYEFVIRVKRKDIPERTQLRKTNSPITGWNAWLSQRPLSESKKNEILDIVVSSRRLQ